MVCGIFYRDREKKFLMCCRYLQCKCMYHSKNRSYEYLFFLKYNQLLFEDRSKPLKIPFAYLSEVLQKFLQMHPSVRRQFPIMFEMILPDPQKHKHPFPMAEEGL